MPIILSEKDPQFGNSVLWSVTESLEFFRDALAESGLNQDHISTWHPARQLEWLSGRFLVSQFIQIPITELTVDQFGKPFFNKSGIYLSISHTNGIVGMQYHIAPVGLDIQIKTDKIHRVAHKFCSEKDYQLLKDYYDKENIERVTWSMKEAIFKAYGQGQVSYKDHILLREVQEINTSRRISAQLIKGNEQADYTGRVRMIGPYCICQVFENSSTN